MKKKLKIFQMKSKAYRDPSTKMIENVTNFIQCGSLMAVLMICLKIDKLTKDRK